MISLTNVDLTNDEMILIKNSIMMHLKDTELGQKRLDGNLANLIDCMKYCMITCLLATNLPLDEMLILLQALFSDSKDMIIDFKSREGLE